ncbi:MAG: shikimate dehydrogenase [Rubrivivax sp.]|jgi:shikimate dehydrogenase
MSDRYAVIGNPIAHSKSPQIHLAFAEATAQDIAYERLLAPEGGFAAVVDAFRAQGARGLNITAPFKLDAYAYATDLTEQARWAGAVNAMKFDGDRVLADNFDGVGLVRDVVHNLGCPMKGRRVLVLGAGGATRGLLLPFLQERPAGLWIANRSVERAVELAQRAASRAVSDTSVQACDYAALSGVGAFDIVFNATSASQSAQALPVPTTVYAPGCLAYDLVYGKGLTPFLSAARAAGAGQVVDGVGMLVEQAAEAFCWWRGVRPDTRAVIRDLTVPLTS